MGMIANNFTHSRLQATLLYGVNYKCPPLIQRFIFQNIVIFTRHYRKNPRPGEVAKDKKKGKKSIPTFQLFQ